MRQNVSKLLKDVDKILIHQKEIELLKGEKFNIFSILKMESKENATHSAFLGELLDPKGSHLQGTVFLELFLKTIGYHTTIHENYSKKEENRKIDLSSARLILEKTIGKTNLNTKTGGRIDIYLVDNKGVSISIENKIYANDQANQIERYVNHNHDRNTVYYLTLTGASASEGSKGDLEDEQHYYCISYRTTIVDWLEKCLKESAQLPILRETIKQYILLIKKLTNQLSDKKMENEITDLLKQNYQSAKAIESNLWKVELEAATTFIQSVTDRIKTELKEDWEILVDEDLNQNYTGIAISHKTWDGIRIVLEGAPKIPWNNSVYGIHAHKNIWDRDQIKKNLSHIDILSSGFNENQHWPFYKIIYSFGSTEKRARLFDSQVIQELALSTAEKMIILAHECETPLAKKTRIKKDVAN